jgi:hypothetical protein
MSLYCFWPTLLVIIGHHTKHLELGLVGTVPQTIWSGLPWSIIILESLLPPEMLPWIPSKLTWHSKSACCFIDPQYSSHEHSVCLLFYWPPIFLLRTFCVLVLLVATLSPVYNLSTPRKRGLVLGVPMSRATGTLLPDLFLALCFVLVPCCSFPASSKPNKRIEG